MLLQGVWFVGNMVVTNMQNTGAFEVRAGCRAAGRCWQWALRWAVQCLAPPTLLHLVHSTSRFLSPATLPTCIRLLLQVFFNGDLVSGA